MRFANWNALSRLAKVSDWNRNPSHCLWKRPLERASFSTLGLNALLCSAKGDLESKHDQYSTALGKLQGQHGRYAEEISRLETEVEQLNLHANELEEQARVARTSANERLKQLDAAKCVLTRLQAKCKLLPSVC